MLQNTLLEPMAAYAFCLGTGKLPVGQEQGREPGPLLQLWPQQSCRLRTRRQQAPARPRKPLLCRAACRWPLPPQRQLRNALKVREMLQVFPMSQTWSGALKR